MSSSLSPRPAYDVDAVRAQFPILSAQVYGKPLVYLDNAASAQKPRAVIDAMVSTMEGGYANVHRGLHYMANAATDAFEEARESVRAFLNAGSTDEIVFTHSATDSINLVADSFGRMAIGEGDEIILSIMEHHSNIVPWHFLRERRGAVIKWAPVDDEGNFLLDEFEKLVSPRTKIVAMTHMSNVLGTMTPIAEVIRIAHARLSIGCRSRRSQPRVIILSSISFNVLLSMPVASTRSRCDEVSRLARAISRAICCRVTSSPT